MIIGLTGPNGGGKGEAVEYLRRKGFQYRSLSDVIRETLAQASQQITRETLIETGRQLRAEHGPDVLARQILRSIDPDGHYIVDSIRNTAEVEAFREQPDFLLLDITAPAEIRFERIRARNREQDPQTLEAFERIEAEESLSDKNAQQVLKCQKLADVTIENDSSLEALRDKIDKIIARRLLFFERPSWDDYFMNIARVVSTRSNCIKRKVAAIIVMDRRIISTGYNGTPRGVKNCNEGGCPRCNSLADSGTRLEECLCSHAEENAITQAAYHGTTINGSTIFSTLAPCLLCTKLIINSGIKEVIYNAEYPLNETAHHLLHEAGVSLRQHRLEPSRQ